MTPTCLPHLSFSVPLVYILVHIYTHARMPGFCRDHRALRRPVCPYSLAGILAGFLPKTSLPLKGTPAGSESADSWRSHESVSRKGLLRARGLFPPLRPTAAPFPPHTQVLAGQSSTLLQLTDRGSPLLSPLSHHQGVVVLCGHSGTTPSSEDLRLGCSPAWNPSPGSHLHSLLPSTPAHP